MFVYFVCQTIIKKRHKQIFKILLFKTINMLSPQVSKTKMGGGLLAYVIEQNPKS